MDGTDDVQDDDPDVVICTDEFGPLNFQPHPARQWAAEAVAACGPAAGAGRPTPAARGAALAGCL